MLDYMRGDGRVYDVEFRFPGNTWESGQERMQTQVDGRRFFHLKGGLGAPACNWEELWYDNDFIWRGTDISPNEEEYYQASEDGTYGQRWTPRKASVGTRHFAKPIVTFRRKSDGALVPGKTPYQFPHWIEVRALHPEYTFESGVKLQNVVEIWGYLHDETAHAPGLNFERYWYAKGFGLVGWQDPTRNWRSYIKTPSVNVGDLVRKVVPGLTLPALPDINPPAPLPTEYATKADLQEVLQLVMQFATRIENLEIAERGVANRFKTLRLEIAPQLASIQKAIE
jgi:hypothetical protein